MPLHLCNKIFAINLQRFLARNWKFVGVDSFICGYVDFGAKSAIIPATFTQMRKVNV